MKLIIRNTELLSEKYLYRNLFDYSSSDNLSGYAINNSTGALVQNSSYGCSYKIPVSYKNDTHLTMSMLTSPWDESSRAIPQDPSFYIVVYGENDVLLSWGTQVTIDARAKYVRMQWWGNYGISAPWGIKLNYGQSF